MTDQADTDKTTRDALLSLALKARAAQADVIAIRSSQMDVSVRKGKIEDAGRAESFGIGLRVFKGARCAYGSTADPSPAGLERLVREVCDMADVVPEDPYMRLARAEECATAWPACELYDDSAWPDIRSLGEQAAAAEATALAYKGITNSDGASAGCSTHHIGISGSQGFCGAYAHGGHYLSVSVIGGQDDAMETDQASSSATYRADLETPETVGRRAAERTLARLYPRSGKTGTFPVLFDRRVSASLLRSLARAASGPRIAKGTSFLCGQLGARILSPEIRVIDDPLKPRGLRSGPFDGEGLPVMRRTIVADGVLQSYFLDLRSAARLNLAPTGHASRGLASPPSPSPSNLWIEAGIKTPAQMAADIGEGFLVTDLMGASISLSTGDYSRGAAGFWIEGGQIAYPVAEMTIAGNLKDMFLRMIAASDLEFRDGIDAPGLLVDGMVTASR